jgi:hypothetical protein
VTKLKEMIIKKRVIKLKEVITKKRTTMTKKRAIIQGNDHQEGDNQDQKKGDRVQGDDHQGGTIKTKNKARELKEPYHQKKETNSTRKGTNCSRMSAKLQELPHIITKRRGVRAHQHTTFSCNHICTQTTRGVRTFVQCTKPKKIVVLEKG